MTVWQSTAAGARLPLAMVGLLALTCAAVRAQPEAEECGGVTFRAQRVKVLLETLANSPDPRLRIEAADKMPTTAEFAPLIIPALLDTLGPQPINIVRNNPQREFEVVLQGSPGNITFVEKVRDLGLDLRIAAAVKLAEFETKLISGSDPSPIIAALQNIPGDYERFRAFATVNGGPSSGFVLRGFDSQRPFIPSQADRQLYFLVARLAELLGRDKGVWVQGVPALIEVLRGELRWTPPAVGKCASPDGKCADNGDLAPPPVVVFQIADEDARAEAASALGRIGVATDPVVEALIFACDFDRSVKVRQAAKEALLKLGGEKKLPQDKN